MEKQVSEVNHQRANLRLRKAKSLSAKSVVISKDRDKDRLGLGNKKQQQLDASRRDAVRAKRMAELMRQLGTVLRQVCPCMSRRVCVISAFSALNRMSQY